MKQPFYEGMGEEIGKTADRKNCNLSKLTSGLKKSLNLILRKTDEILRQQKAGENGKWLTENRGMIRGEGKQAIRVLSIVKRLPGDRRTGMPYLYTLLKCGLGDGTDFDPETLSLLLTGYEKRAYLGEKELSCLYSLLVAAVICTLSEKMSDEPGSAEKNGVVECIGILHNLRGGAFEQIPLAHNPVERILSADPSGEYPFLDKTSRDRYRRMIEKEARREGILPDAYAEKLLEKYPSVCDGLDRIAREHLSKGRAYFPLILLASLLTAAGLCYFAGNLYLFPLLFFSAAEGVKTVADGILLRVIPPRRLPRLSLTEGIPEDGKTLCVITSLLCRPEDGERLCRRLYEFFLANRECGKNLFFGIVADLPDGKKAKGNMDEEILQRARAAVSEYNGLSPRFFLFTRPRTLNKQDGVYMGWERKRGALNDLFDTLRGEHKMQIYGGTLPTDIRFVLTLDSDTRAEPYSILPMVGTLLCPQNRPTIGKGRVIGGYGMAEPRISVDLECANRNPFARIFNGNGGCDPYGSMAGDLYNDLCGEAIFTGKGLIDVDCYRKVLGQRLPENRILSHDLLESAYLRCAYLGDVEMTDGCPDTAASFYQRLQRWIRGDIQILSWALRRVPTADKKEKNPLNSLSRFKILDNFRRALSPPAFLVLLGISAFAQKNLFWVCFISGLSGLWLPLIFGTLVGEIGKPEPGARKFRSAVLSGLGGLCLKLFCEICFLPIKSFFCIDGIIRGFWSLLTGRGRLRWITSEQTRKERSDIARAFRLLYPEIALGVLLLSGNALGMGMGTLFLLSLPVCRALEKPKDRACRMTSTQKEELLAYAGPIWKFFEDHLCPEDHYLMPDNLQIEPYIGIAHRTSPTNIGFSLCAVVAGADLSFISFQRAEMLLTRMLSTLEELPKWKGHLYNWTDTRTLRPLTPCTVSTVDSGNLLASLLICKVFCLENGLVILEKRFERLISAMDFSVLYDTKRDLFHIGYFPKDGKPMGGHYDLLASEARLTAFLAASFGYAGPKHWGRLSRGLVGHRGYAGLASWSGSMFEYLMPELFLPEYPNSLLWETARFCVGMQRKHRPRKCNLWGTSESGYGLFDAHMAYQYKAHGVPGLAVRSGMWADRVLSPYSVFLSLPYGVAPALKALKKFEERKMKGPYGLYEAIDLTPQRVGARKADVIASFMAHHMGMSLLSIHRVLTDNGMGRRMLTLPEISAFAGLLKERLFVGGELMHREPAPRGENGKHPGLDYAAVTGGSTENPEGLLFSNGAYTLLLTDTGLSRALWEGNCVYRCDQDRYFGTGGITGTFITENEQLPLWSKEEGACVRCVASADSGVFESRGSSVGVVSEIYLLRKAPCEIREIRLLNRKNKPVTGELRICGEPLLCPEGDYEAHPTYKRLFLTAERVGDTLLFFRREKRQNLCCGLKLVGANPEFCTDRERRNAPPLSKEGRQPWSPNPCMDVCTRVNIPPLGDVSIRMVLCCGVGREEVLRGISYGTGPSPERADPVLHALSVRSHRAAGFHREAQKISARLLGGHIGGSVPEILPQNGYRLLWRMGLSGDIPLLLAQTDMDGGMQAFPLYCFAMYRRAGISCEMAIVLWERRSYFQPERQSVLDLAADMGITPSSGLHLFHREEISDEQWECLRLAAYIDFTAAYCPKNLIRNPQKHFLPENGETEKELGTFSRIPSGHMPPYVWSTVLTGEKLGCIMQNNGPGELWYQNARLFRLTDWTMDPLGENLQEEICFSDGDRSISLFQKQEEPGSVTFDAGRITYRKSAEGVKLKTDCFCARSISARVMIIEGFAERPLMLCWQIRPLMGEKRENRAFLVAHPTDRRGLCFENCGGLFFPGVKFLCTANLVTESRSIPGVGSDCVGQLRFASVQNRFSVVLVAGVWENEQEKEALYRLTDPESAKREMEKCLAYYRERCNILKPGTPDADLNRYLSGACLYQTLACRLESRVSLWQGGGGFGFRDQLQDCCALVYADRQRVRDHILLCCERQYTEGDVMHWWHELQEGCRGVRTRCSDDLLWLPYTVWHYVNVTGDRDILKENASYLSSPPLEHGENTRYETPERSGKEESVLMHCIRACDTLTERGFGLHGLPLMLGGDWNDGMDCVGREGKGESVWLSFFAAHVFQKTAELCREEGMKKKAEELTFLSSALGQAGLSCREEGHFLRAYQDNGEPLGGKNAIDSIAQAFSTWVEQGNTEEKKQAVCKGVERLYDREHHLIRLLDPPYEMDEEHLGYLGNYPPGVRENGGQYTHGAIWLAMSCFAVNEKQLGWELLRALVPNRRPESVRKTEDFVLSGDVYAHPDRMGQSGWSWYTGAAGWFFQSYLTCILGLRAKNGVFSFDPFLPEETNRMETKLRIGKTELTLTVQKGEKGMFWDGKTTENAFRLWEIEGEHTLLVMI